MLDVYPVYLNWAGNILHSVSCVSRTSQTRNTYHRRESTCCPYTISRRIADSLKLPAARSSASRSVAVQSRPSPRHSRGAPHLRSTLHLACAAAHASPHGSTQACRGLVYFVPVYLAVYLVCICFRPRNTCICVYLYPYPCVSGI